MAPREHDFHELRWRISSDIRKERVELDGQAFPRRFDATVSHPDWPFRVVVTVGIDVERGPVLAGVAAHVDLDNDKPVNTARDALELLSSTIDPTLLLQELAADAVGEVVKWQLYSQSPERMDMSADVQAELIAQISEAHEEARSTAYSASRPRRRRVITKQYLAEVAQIYRAAVSEGRPPTQAVAAHFQTSHSSAAKHVHRARQEGELGPAVGTRPGEVDR